MNPVFHYMYQMLLLSCTHQFKAETACIFKISPPSFPLDTNAALGKDTLIVSDWLWHPPTLHFWVTTFDPLKCLVMWCLMKTVRCKWTVSIADCGMPFTWCKSWIVWMSAIMKTKPVERLKVCQVQFSSLPVLGFCVRLKSNTVCEERDLVCPVEPSNGNWAL